MTTYFKPRRRKIGLVTLSLACALAGAWVRSLTILDEIGIRRDNSYHKLDFTCGAIVWVSEQPLPLKGTHQGRQWATLTDDFKKYPTVFGWETDAPLEQDMWHLEALGFAYGLLQSPERTHIVRIVPYWSIVFPLTLSSAWLLLSKTPMTKPQKQSTR